MRILLILIKAGKWFVLLTLLSALFFRFVPIPATPLMLYRCGEQGLQGEPLKMDHQWVSLSSISPYLQLAVVCSEDQNFLKHEGLDLDAIQDAQKYNEKHKKKQRGASTISQQTAKNVFLLPTRSWIRKGLEVYFTANIEVFWTKRRIMEAYLNSIEMGDGIYGAEAAARRHFGKHASQLSPQEAALIAAILPDPINRNPAKPTPYLLKRQGQILRQMGYWGMTLNYDDVETGNSEGWITYSIVLGFNSIALLIAFVLETLIQRRLRKKNDADHPQILIDNGQ